MSSLILLPFSIYLTSRATKDRALVDADSILIPLKKLVVSNADTQVNNDKQTSSEEIRELHTFENEKLINIVKNFRQYKHALNYKQSALAVLNSRGISELELKMSGDLTNLNYENAVQYYIDFKENSKLGLALNSICLVLGLGGLILNNNGFPFVGKTFTVIAVLVLIFFLIVLKKTIKNQSSFYDFLEVKFFNKAFILILIGMPIFYFYRKYFITKMEEDLNKIA